MINAPMSRAHHVAVAIKSLYASEKLLIIAKGDEDLGVIADRLLEDREGSLVNFVLLELANLRLVEVRLWLVLVIAVGICQYLFYWFKMEPPASWWSGVEWPKPNISENFVGTGARTTLARRCCLSALYNFNKYLKITDCSGSGLLVNLYGSGYSVNLGPFPFT